MTRIAGLTTFARTPEEVFDFLADPRNEPSYNPLIVSARKVTPGRIGPGARFVQQTRRFGRTSEVIIDLVDFNRPQHLSWHITSSGMDVHGEERLIADGHGTQVRWIWDFATRGPLRLLGPLIGLAGRRIENGVWSNMKRTLDSATSQPDSATL
jgi:carbon monoxide dehydrogenase subunit G